MQPCEFAIGGGSNVIGGFTASLFRNTIRHHLEDPERHYALDYEEKLTFWRVGGFIQVYPWITGGWHLDGQLSLASAQFEDSDAQLGVGLGFGTGYHVWLASHWSAGLTANLTYLRLPGNLPSWLPTLTLSVTYN